MAGKKQEMQRFYHYYKDQTGEKEVDLKKVAVFAAANGWTLPEPIDALTRLSKQFAEALREETRQDRKTGRTYRANHVYVQNQGTLQLHLWIDIDEAPRGPMFKALQMRRGQMVGDAVSLADDADHWNSIHPTEAKIELEFDFGPDVEWRKASPGEDELKAS